MRTRPVLGVAIIALAIAITVVGAYAQNHTGDRGDMGSAMKTGEKPDMMTPFGGPQDVEFAKALWKAIEGYRDWTIKSEAHPGKSPHGSFLRIYYDIVNIDGRPYHVLVKDNYGGEGLTMQMVDAAPSKHLVAITAMVQREPGYDPEDNDWFYVKYKPDGSIATAQNDVAMAGRVAKGMAAGCIPCHVKAGGGDFVFWNDK